MSSFLSTPRLSDPHTRRQFLNLGLTGLCGAALMGGLAKLNADSARALLPPPRKQRVTYVGEVRDLHLYNPNTRETANFRFFANGTYNPQALQQLNIFLRDFHYNIGHVMDPELLTLIHDMQDVFGKRVIHVLSAYRTVATNNRLVREHVTTAKDSFHCKGQAIDIRIPGIPVNAMRDVAKILRVGGVGYYPTAHFVHVDTGPVRYW